MDKRSEILRAEYQNRFKENESYRDGVWQILCETIFSRYVKPNHIVLDLGSGWGEFTRNIKAAKKYAMDLNPDSGQRVAKFAKFLQQDCSKKWPLKNESLDIVFTSNFFEHLPHKGLIDKALSEAYRSLKKGGQIICVGPNSRYLAGSYWDFWDHYIPITGTSMVEALQLHKFSIKKRVDRFLPFTMSSGKNPPLFAVKAYLKTPIFWPLFGKQFYIVGQK